MHAHSVLRIHEILNPGRNAELVFVGGLVPLKACDLALRAAAPILRNNTARFTVIGDGPERGRLEQLAKTLGIENSVSFCGWLSSCGSPEQDEICGYLFVSICP